VKLSEDFGPELQVREESRRCIAQQTEISQVGMPGGYGFVVQTVENFVHQMLWYKELSAV